MKDWIKLTTSVIGILFFIWCLVFGTDFYKTMVKLEKPLFAIGVATADDGGSGLYKGLAYQIEIEGNFLTLDSNPGVKNATFYLFGTPICSIQTDTDSQHNEG